MKVSLWIICEAMQTNQNKQTRSAMITLYHCDAARSFRPLWMLEELSLTYELKMHGSSGSVRT